jgi:hypothetical protein
MFSDPVHRAFSISDGETERCSARVTVSHISIVGIGLGLVMIDICVIYLVIAAMRVTGVQDRTCEVLRQVLGWDWRKVCEDRSTEPARIAWSVVSLDGLWMIWIWVYS